MSFTDQKPRIATKQDLDANWGGKENGAWFRCYLCGHKFIEGDYWRWVHHGNKLSNFITCKNCDGEDVKKKWEEMTKEAQTKFWWFLK